MSDHAVGTREEWLAARLELLEAEKALTRRSDEVAGMRQELACVPVENECRFDTDDGPASLADLFDGRKLMANSSGVDWPTYTQERPGISAFVLRTASSTTPIRPTRAGSTGSGGCTSCSIERRSDATSPISGGAVTTTTTASKGDRNART